MKESATVTDRVFKNQKHPRKLADAQVIFTYRAQSVLGPLDVLTALAQHLAGVWGKREPRQVLGKMGPEGGAVQFCSLHAVEFGGRFWIHSVVKKSGKVLATICLAEETGTSHDSEF